MSILKYLYIWAYMETKMDESMQINSAADLIQTGA